MSTSLERRGEPRRLEQQSGFRSAQRKPAIWQPRSARAERLQLLATGPRLEDPGARRYGPQIPGGVVQPRQPHRLRNARRYCRKCMVWHHIVYAPLQESVRLEVHVLMTAG